VRKHRKTAKKVMRGGWGKKNIYYGILCDSIPMIMDSKSLPGRGIELEYILPIFIIVMYGDDLFLFFNKNITSQEITTILKSILGINQEVTLTLDPPIELPAVLVDAPPQPVGSTPQPVGSTPQPVDAPPQPVGSTPQPVGSTPQPVGSTPQPVGSTPQPVGSTKQTSDAPPYKGTPISNINDIEKIYNWSLSDADNTNSPSKLLLETIFRDYVDPFQHIISKRFIMLKGKRMYMIGNKTFENDIYSGEVSDTIPLDKINDKSLTKHKITSPTSDVITERFKSLMSGVNNEEYFKLKNHVFTLERDWANVPQKELYKEYIPPDDGIALSLYYSDPKLTTTPAKEWIQIYNKPSYEQLGKPRRSLFGDVKSYSDLIPKNVLTSINKDTEKTWGRQPGASTPGLGGLFIPFPRGWFHPPKSSTTTTTSATSAPSATSVPSAP